MRPWQNKTGGSVMAKQDQIRTFLSVTVDLKKQVPYQAFWNSWRNRGSLPGG